MDRTTTTDRGEVFVQQMTDRMASLARSLSDWVQAEAHPMQEIEAQVVRVMHDLGNSLLAALLPLAAPTRPSPDVPPNMATSARRQWLVRQPLPPDNSCLHPMVGHRLHDRRVVCIIGA